MAEIEARTVMLAGASGFVGNLTLDALLDAPDVSRVFAITRRPLGREHPRLANRIVQFDRIEAQLKGLTCHAALCCLGSAPPTARSEQTLRQVDVETVMMFARAAKAAQVHRFVVLSSVGADPQSRNPNLRTKAEMEAQLVSLGFASLDILQPGRLLGWRHGMRPSELLATAAMPLVNIFLVGAREPYRGVAARTLARAMLGAMRSGRRGVQRYTHSGIQFLARRQPQRGMAAAEPKAPLKAR